MKSGCNDSNYFKLTKLANFVQFKRMLMFCLEDWGPGPRGPPLATPLLSAVLGCYEGGPRVRRLPVSTCRRSTCHTLLY